MILIAKDHSITPLVSRRPLPDAYVDNRDTDGLFEKKKEDEGREGRGSFRENAVLRLPSWYQLNVNTKHG
jgi:hypothetical protein